MRLTVSSMDSPELMKDESIMIDRSKNHHVIDEAEKEAISINSNNNKSGGCFLSQHQSQHATMKKAFRTPDSNEDDDDDNTTEQAAVVMTEASSSLSYSNATWGEQQHNVVVPQGNRRQHDRTTDDDDDFTGIVDAAALSPVAKRNNLSFRMSLREYDASFLESYSEKAMSHDEKRSLPSRQQQSHSLSLSCQNNNDMKSSRCQMEESESCHPDSMILPDDHRIQPVKAMIGSNICKMRRTESTERRLNEAAQFAEAIGEGIDDTIIHIIDDDKDEDDYYDEQEQNSNESLLAMNLYDDSIHHKPEINHNILQADHRTDILNNYPESSIETLTTTKKNDNHGWIIPTRDLEGHVTNRSSLIAPKNMSSSCPERFMTSTSFVTSTHQLRRRRLSSTGSEQFLDKLPDGYNSQPASAKQLDFVYKGIVSNPPEIVKSGTTRGNYAMLHRKAWLEVSDKYHRYGKNLRLYYRHWESLGFPTNMFFDWLDSKGEASGKPLPELSECPRCILDADTVLYITDPNISSQYALDFLPIEMSSSSSMCIGGVVVNSDDRPVRTGSDGWIFVLRDHVMYGAPKITTCDHDDQTTKQRFHHSSFFGGKAVAAAGIFITNYRGIITHLFPHSGHYRPGEAHIQRVLFYLYERGIDLSTITMDTQQIFHVARDHHQEATPPKEPDHPRTPEERNTAKHPLSSLPPHQDGHDKKKKKKMDSLYLMPAIHVACYLAHKARCIELDIFRSIHNIFHNQRMDRSS